MASDAVGIRRSNRARSRPQPPAVTADTTRSASSCTSTSATEALSEAVCFNPTRPTSSELERATRMITRMKAAVRQVTERVRVADERGRVPPQPAAAARLVEADEVIKALHELQLIAQSSRPDRRSVAYAIAALRGELSGGPSDQASLFGLYVKGLPRLRDEWLNDEDARLKQALAFRALSAAERESFVAARAAPPTDEDLALRQASKRQRLEDGAAPPALQLRRASRARRDARHTGWISHLTPASMGLGPRGG